MNFVITLSKELWIHEAIAEWFDDVVTKFIVNNRTDAYKTDINLYFTLSLADASHGLISEKDDQSMNKNFVVFDGHRLSSIIIVCHRSLSIPIDCHQLTISSTCILLGGYVKYVSYLYLPKKLLT